MGIHFGGDTTAYTIFRCSLKAKLSCSGMYVCLAFTGVIKVNI